MSRTTRIGLVLIAVRLALPWICYMVLEATGGFQNANVISLLSSGGGRGHLGTMAFYGIPTALVGVGVGVVLGVSRLSIGCIVAAASVAACLASLYLVRAQTQHWEIPTIGGEAGITVGRLVQVVFVIGVGSLFGYGAATHRSPE